MRVLVLATVLLLSSHLSPALAQEASRDQLKGAAGDAASGACSAGP